MLKIIDKFVGIVWLSEFVAIARIAWNAFPIGIPRLRSKCWKCCALKVAIDWITHPVHHWLTILPFDFDSRTDRVFLKSIFQYWKVKIAKKFQASTVADGTVLVIFHGSVVRTGIPLSMVHHFVQSEIFSVDYFFLSFFSVFVLLIRFGLFDIRFAAIQHWGTSV